MKIRYIFIMAFLTAVMLFSSATVFGLETQGADDGTNDIQWSVSNGTLTISGEGPIQDYGSSGGPWKSSNIYKIVISDGITRIGNYAFTGCYSVQSCSIPQSVKSIGQGAFGYNEKWTDFVIPDGVETIESKAFFCNEQLKTVSIPKSVNSISEDAFFCCSFLTSITVDSNNDYYSSSDGMLFNKDGTRLICVPKHNASGIRENCIVPDGVQTIGKYAFYDTAITSVELPASLTKIEADAFISSTNKIKKVTFKGGKPQGVDSVLDTNSFTAEEVIYPCGGEGWENYIKIYPTKYNWTVEHNYEYTVFKSATCTDDGEAGYYCVGCDTQKGDTIILISQGHKWDSDYTIDKEATCVSDGSKSIHCSVCDATKGETIIEKTGVHTWGQEYIVDKEPTCGENGVKSKHCLYCDAKDDFVEIPMTEKHVWENGYTIDIKPTKEQEGTKSIHCTSCSAKKDETSIPKLEISDKKIIDTNSYSFAQAIMNKGEIAGSSRGISVNNKRGTANETATISFLPNEDKYIFFYTYNNGMFNVTVDYSFEESALNSSEAIVIGKYNGKSDYSGSAEFIGVDFDKETPIDFDVSVLLSAEELTKADAIDRCNTYFGYAMELWNSSCEKYFGENMSKLGFSCFCKMHDNDPNRTALEPATEVADGIYYVHCKNCGHITYRDTPRIASVSVSDVSYSGNTVRPTVEIKDVTGDILRVMTDYDVLYDDPVNVGEGTVNIKLKGCYAGEYEKKYSVIPFDISKATAKASTAYYNGKVQKPKVTVTELSADSFTVKYLSGSKKVGTYSAVISGLNAENTIGTKTIKYTINPKGTTIKTPARAKKAFTAKWARQSTKMSTDRITGYQVQYSRSSTFASGNKTVTVKGYRATSKKISKLKAKKKYYVRVRTYMKTGGKTYYSAWSSKKAVTTK